MVESFLNWLLKRSLRQESIATSSTRTTAGDAPETSASQADQVRRQRDRLLTQWSLESGLPTAEYVVAMHDLAANLPHYVGGGRSENLT